MSTYKKKTMAIACSISLLLGIGYYLHFRTSTYSSVKLAINVNNQLPKDNVIFHPARNSANSIITETYIIPDPKGPFFEFFKYNQFVFKDDSIKKRHPKYILFCDAEEKTIEDTLHLRQWQLGVNADLSFFLYTGVPNRKSKRQSEYIKYYDQIFNIDSLFQHNVNGYKFDKMLYLSIEPPIYFCFNRKNYLLLRCEYRKCFYSEPSGASALYILMETENKRCSNIWTFHNVHFSRNVFGDYGCDGKLNYLSYGIMKDTITVYTLERDRFVKDNYHYLVMEPSGEQRAFFKKYKGYTTWYEQINRKASKWFYDLGESPQNDDGSKE